MISFASGAPPEPGMRRIEPEPGDRAVDDSVGNVVRADSETFRDPRPKALEDDVRTGAQRACETGVGLEVTHDRLRSGPQGGVPCEGGRTHGVSLGRLYPHDARAEAAELAARIRAREEAREVDDERSRERLHRGGAYLYPRAR